MRRIVLASLAAGVIISTGFAALSQVAPVPTIAADPNYKGSTAKNPLGTLVYAHPQPAPYVDEYAGKKKILFVADTQTRTPLAHEAVSHAMGTIEQLARKAGYVVFLRTDTGAISRGPVYGAYATDGSLTSPGRNLNDFDAVVYYSSGETEMNQSQKRDLLKFVREDGKGFVGIHTAAVSLHTVPEYGEMLGAYFDTHPWFITTARMKVERPEFPGLQGFAANPTIRDEHYQFREPFDRNNVDVLMSIDNTSVDLKNENVHRTDADFPVAWVKTYGKGRVFYSYLGHLDSSWDDQRVQSMYIEAIKWAVGDTAYAVRPHKKVQ